MTGPEAAATYKIEVEGRIDPGWSEWLDQMAIRHDHDSSGRPVTVLTGLVTDQSALRGLLAKLWNLNVSVLNVRRMEEGGTGKRTTGGTSCH
jgi:hypothetical protein